MKIEYKPCRLLTYKERRDQWNDENYEIDEVCEDCNKVRKVSSYSWDDALGWRCYRCYMSTPQIMYGDCKGCDDCYRDPWLELDEGGV